MVTKQEKEKKRKELEQQRQQSIPKDSSLLPKVTQSGGGGSPQQDEGTAEVFKSGETGKASGVQIDGRTFFGLGPDDVQQIINRENQRRQTLGEEPIQQTSVEEARGREQRLQELTSTLEEGGVFKQEQIQQPIISPEQQNLGVMTRIAQSLVPKGVRDVLFRLPGQESPFDKIVGEQQEAITDAEINYQNHLLKAAIDSEINSELDAEIAKAEETLTQFGIGAPLAGAAGIVLGGAFLQPLSQFVGDDRKIGNLEQALSLYSEALSRPASAVQNGLSPEEGFAKLNRIEAAIFLLEERIKLAALTSPNVAISLRNAGIETRLQNLKDRLQFERTNIANKAIAQATEEQPITQSAAYLQQLKAERGLT